MYTAERTRVAQTGRSGERKSNTSYSCRVKSDDDVVGRDSGKNKLYSHVHGMGSRLWGPQRVGP